MPSSRKILDQMRREPNNVRFGDLKKVCEAYQVRQVLLAIDKLEGTRNER